MSSVNIQRFGGNEPTREGVDTRTKDLTGAGTVSGNPELGVPAVERGNDVGRVKVCVNADGSVSFTYAPVDNDSGDGLRDYVDEVLGRLSSEASTLVKMCEELMNMPKFVKTPKTPPARRPPPRKPWNPYGRNLGAFEVAAMVMKMTGSEPVRATISEPMCLMKKANGAPAPGVGTVVVDGVSMEVPV